MKRTLVLIFVPLLLTGCVDGKFIKRNVPNTCSTTGWTITTVHYGDSYLVVIPLSEIVEDGEWRFVLDPQDDPAYENATVRVRGKTPADAWFVEETGTFSGDGHIKLCINNQVSVGDIVQFDVDIDGVGTLDPRARVIIRPD